MPSPFQPHRTQAAGRRPMLAHVRRASLALLAAVSLPGCAGTVRPHGGDQAALAACRSEANRDYLRHNRELLLDRSQRDSPFSSSGTIGVTSEGLPQLYGRDEQIESCLRARRAADAQTQPGASTGVSPQMDPERTGSP